MDAPLYPPAQAYERPAPLYQPMTTTNTSIARMMAVPAVYAMLKEEISGLDARVGNPMLKPHLDNFSFRGMVQFGAFQAGTLDRVDARLRAMATGREGAQ